MDLRIYNLYPRLYQRIDDWYSVAEKAADMKFNAIYLNPFLHAGKSESVYSISDYYRFDERIFKEYTRKESTQKLKNFLHYCAEIGLLPIFDLVVNHTAIDSLMIRECPQWYQWEETGKVKMPTFLENGAIHRWHDCALLDYAKDKGLTDWVVDLCCYYLDMGFRGFRCDVAGYIPAAAWEKIITAVRAQYPQTFFMAEAFTVGKDVLSQLGKAGFNYCYDSSRWWNFRNETERNKDWFFQDLDNIQTSNMKSISFPENHDTARLMTEYNGNVDMVRQELILMGMIGAAFQITSGFEYGYRNKIHVVKTDYQWQEQTQVDFTVDIKRVNQMRIQHPIFRQEGQFRIYSQSDSRLLVLHKITDEQQALIVLNCTAEEFVVSAQDFFSAFEEKNVSMQDFSIGPYGVWYYVFQGVKKNAVLKNKSLCLVGRQEIVLSEKVLFPRIAGESVVRIEACGICGSDRQEFRHGRFYWRAADCGGHEIAGTIVEISAPEYGLRVGDYVSYCLPRTGSGISQGGGFSQYAVIKNDCLVKIDRSIRPEIAVLIEPLACAVHAMKFLQQEKKIAIVGSGAIALLLERVIYQTDVEQSSESLKVPLRNITLFYKHKLITKYLNSRTNAVQYCESEFPTRPWEVFDVIYDCSGSEQAVRWAVDKLVDNGRLILTGIYRNGGIMFPLSGLMFGEKSVIGSFLYTREDFLQSYRWIREKSIQTEDLIQLWDSSECRQAFQQPSGNYIKSVLLWKGE